jgi:hypothetical protein
MKARSFRAALRTNSPLRGRNMGLMESAFFPANRLHTLIGEEFMGTCEVCGNEYDKAFEVSMAGSRYTFDSFECAIHALAPSCTHCGCRIIGHGVEGQSGLIFCSAFCAKQEGVSGVQDRAS